jgi:hypothetical protein
VHKKRVRTKKICGVDELLGNLKVSLSCGPSRSAHRLADRLRRDIACGFGIDDDDVWIELVDRL